MLTDLVDLDDVGVLERRHRLRFDEKPSQRIGAGVSPGEHHLEGDEPVELLLPRLVHDAHAAAAELAEDLVAADMWHRPPGLRVDRGENRIGDRRREGDARVATRGLARQQRDGAVVDLPGGGREVERRAAIGTGRVVCCRDVERGVVGGGGRGSEVNRGVGSGLGREVDGGITGRLGSGGRRGGGDRGVAGCRGAEIDGGIAPGGAGSGIAAAIPLLVVGSAHHCSSNNRALRRVLPALGPRGGGIPLHAGGLPHSGKKPIIEGRAEPVQPPCRGPHARRQNASAGMPQRSRAAAASPRQRRASRG